LDQGVTQTLAVLSSGDLALIREFKSDPSDRRKRQTLNTLYWEVVFKTVRERTGGGQAESLGLANVASLIDSGLLEPSLIEGGDAEIRTVAKENSTAEKSLVFPFSEWVEKEYQRILNFDKRDALKSDIGDLNHQLLLKDREISSKQNERKAQFTATLEEALTAKGMNNSQTKGQILARFDKSKALDELKAGILRSQKQVATGKFLDVQGKRDLASQQQEYQKQFLAFKSVLTEIRSPVQEKELNILSDEINTLISERIDTEIKKERKEVELQGVSNLSATLSPVEIDSQMSESIDYFKGLMTLCSKRARSEAFSVWTAQIKPNTVAKLRQVIALIEEFDPKVFKNERAQFIGMPKFILVPGFGNSLYDWKNNAILVPTLSPGKIEDSVFAGIVEYKLDMDEDKALLMSYNKLEENKLIRSFLRLKEKFAKDYAVFMGMETRGYKVLPKDTRAWFNREIAPNRNEIKIPFEFDPAAMKREEYEELRRGIESSISDGKATSRQYFGMGIFHNYDEQFEKAAESFRKSFEMMPDFFDALYNLAIIHIKRSSRKEAVECLTEFLKRSPQNWWTSVCQEHLLKLR
jgi:tetratricopeptide (TPR) repeat protein